MLGSAIKNARQRLGLSAEEVAQKVGVHRNMIYRWESGGAEPSAENLYKFSKLVGVTIPELYGEAPPGSEMLEISKRLLEADRRSPGTVERLMQLIHQGFLDTPEDMEDLLHVAKMLQRRSEK